MAEGGSYARNHEEEDERFYELLQKLAGIEPPTDVESRVFRRSAAANAEQDQHERRMRTPMALPPYPPAKTMQVGHTDPDVVYEDGPTGLRATGWMLFPSKHLGSGAFGAVMLGMKIADRDKDPYQRRICAIKVQSMYRPLSSRSELTALQCLVHEHIIDYYDHFLVMKQPGSKDLVKQTEMYVDSSRILGGRKKEKMDDVKLVRSKKGKKKDDPLLKLYNNMTPTWDIESEFL